MNISKRTDNELLDTLEMLSHVLDEKKYNETLNVISQLFMGWKFDFGEDGLSMLRAHAHSIYRNTCKKLSEQEETKCHLVDDNTNDQELDMDEISDWLEREAKIIEKESIKKRNTLYENPLIILDGGKKDDE